MTSITQSIRQLTPRRIRSAWRDTFIYASNDHNTVLGGLLATEGMSNENLYSMVKVICIFTDAFHIQDNEERLVGNDAHALLPGNYYIVTNGSVTVTDEVPLCRQISMRTGIRSAAFSEAVRDRDRCCVITGRPAVINDVTYWDAFEAAHVFPLKYEGLWSSATFRDSITIPPASESHGAINSVQNGILLSRDIHALFDSYQIAINPEEDHMIVCFTEAACSYGIAGAYLELRFLENPLRPPDDLLSWHFRQAVLVNMKGAGETRFEMDFPPGSGTMGQVVSDQKVMERMDPEGLVTPNRQGVRA